MSFFFKHVKLADFCQALRLEARVKQSQVYHGYVDETLPKVPVVYNACPGMQDVFSRDTP